MSDAALPTLAVCLPARNSAATIERLIASVREHADEICVYLAGESTDGTPELLAQLATEPGAAINVRQGDWNDDYARARDESFAMASSDWLMWADDDEIVFGATHLRPYLAASPSDSFYVRRVEAVVSHEPRAEWYPRIVRGDVGAWWYPAIHERLTVPEGATEDAIPPSVCEVVHHPTPKDGRHDHRPLVERELARTGDVELRSYLGRYLFDDGDYAAAAAGFERVIADAAAIPAQKERAAYRLSQCRFRLGDVAAATDALALQESFSDEWRRTRPDVFARIEALEHAHPITSSHPVYDYLNAGALVPVKSDRERMAETLRNARRGGVSDAVWAEVMRDVGMAEADIAVVLSEPQAVPA